MPQKSFQEFQSEVEAHFSAKLFKKRETLWISFYFPSVHIASCGPCRTKGSCGQTEGILPSLNLFSFGIITCHSCCKKIDIADLVKCGQGTGCLRQSPVQREWSPCSGVAPGWILPSDSVAAGLAGASLDLAAGSAIPRTCGEPGALSCLRLHKQVLYKKCHFCTIILHSCFVLSFETWCVFYPYVC